MTAAVCIAESARGQTPEVPLHRVEGRVVRPQPDDRTARPIGGVLVTLHRIGSDSAGALDSLITGTDGRYEFRWRPFGSEDALYMVSAEYHGITYFGSPVGQSDVTGDEAELVVFDTTSSPVPISINARHVIVSSPFEGWRQIAEVYELSNDTLLTAVPGARERAVWTVIVPEAASGLSVPDDQGVASSALELRDGRVLWLAPLTPGIRQIAFSYIVPIDAFPASVPIERAVGTLEVLLEEPEATATAPGLAETDPVAVEGRTFRRFVARDVPAGGVLSLRPPSPPPSSRVLYIAVTVTVIGALMLLVLARTFSQGALARRPVALHERSEQIDRRIAALDAAFAHLPAPTDEARQTYQAQRTDLVAARDAALAREHRRA